VLEHPGLANAILGRRRLLGRTILVTLGLGYAIGGAKTLEGLLRRQPVAWVNLHTETLSYEDAKKLHLLVARVVRDHPEREWRDLLLRGIATDLADLEPQTIESRSWFAG